MRKRILAVEDEPAIASLIAWSLTDCGYDVEVVHDGEQGLKRAMSGEYALVMLDLALPKMDGLSICRSLRESGFVMPILILTALGAATGGIHDLSLHGADDLMLKPFDIYMLQQRVNSLIEESSAVYPEIWIGGLLFSMKNRTLALDGATIPLTPMEFSLLEFLVRYRGRVVAYRLMEQHLWGSAATSHLATDVLVNAIQVKSGGVPIEHVPRVGYRLE